jgi:hypothetical protein
LKATREVFARGAVLWKPIGATRLLIKTAEEIQTVACGSVIKKRVVISRTRRLVEFSTEDDNQSNQTVERSNVVGLLDRCDTVATAHCISELRLKTRVCVLVQIGPDSYVFEHRGVRVNSVGAQYGRGKEASQ